VRIALQGVAATPHIRPYFIFLFFWESSFKLFLRPQAGAISPDATTMSTSEFQRRFSPCEEDKRSQPNPPMWNGSRRWFRSANVIDLWIHRTPDERRRMIDLAFERWRRANGGIPDWPPD
jgi:hypothetical protein